MIALLATLWFGGLTYRIAEVPLIPPEALPLGGYTARGSKLSEPGGDILRARALVVSDGPKTAAIVTLEMLTVPASLYREVKKRLPPDVFLMLCATHTHSAPDSQMLNDQMTFQVPGIAKFSGKWLKWYADRIAMSVKAALAAPKAPWSAPSLKQFHIGVVRGRRPFAAPDGLVVEALDRGKPLILSLAAHPVFYGSTELRTRGEWPGEEMNRWPGVVIQGCLGDISPVPEGTNPIGNIAFFCERIDAGAEFAKPEEFPLEQIGYFEFPLPMDSPSPHPSFAKAYGVPQALANVFVNQVATKKANLYALRIGGLAIIGVPGEPSSDIGKRISRYGRSLGFQAVIVAAHVNGWIGYVLDPDDYARGGYEATLNLNGPRQGELLVDASCRALWKLAFPGRPFKGSSSKSW